MKSPYKTIIGINVDNPTYVFVENYFHEKIQRLDKTYNDVRDSIKNSNKCIGVWKIKYKN